MRRWRSSVLKQLIHLRNGEASALLAVRRAWLFRIEPKSSEMKQRHMIRNGQVRWLTKNDLLEQVSFRELV
jgi:hypothetical protein